MINTIILMGVVYYYYYMFQQDSKLKNSLNETVKENLEFENTHPVIKPLNLLKKYVENNLVSQELFRKIIYYTNKIYKDKSLFYKNYLTQLLYDLEISLNDKKFNILKSQIIDEINKLVVNKEPISFDFYKTKNNFDAF